MSDNLAVLSRVIARLNAGVVLAAFLLLMQAINFPTKCLAHDISIAENGRHTAGPHESGASPIHRNAFGEDPSHNFAFGYLEFDRTSDMRGEPRRITENAKPGPMGGHLEGFHHMLFVSPTIEVGALYDRPVS
jgi:hypothetical protein